MRMPEQVNDDGEARTDEVRVGSETHRLSRFRLHYVSSTESPSAAAEAGAAASLSFEKFGCEAFKMCGDLTFWKEWRFGTNS